MCRAWDWEESWLEMALSRQRFLVAGIPNRPAPYEDGLAGGRNGVRKIYLQSLRQRHIGWKNALMPS